MKQLPFDLKIDRKLQLNEEWRAVAKSYLLHSRFAENIQSLGLEHPQILEEALQFVENPTTTVIKNLCGRGRLVKKNFDAYKTSSKKNEFTDMWLRMAVMICQTVEDRVAVHPQDLLGSGLVTICQHYWIVTALLLEVLAASPGSLLRRNYLGDTNGSTESPLEDSGRKGKRGVEEQTGGNKEAAGEVDGGPSMLGDHSDEARVDRDLESQEIPSSDTHHPHQQSAAPIAVMFVPSKQHQTTSSTAPTNAPEQGRAGTELAEQANGDPNDDGLGGAEQDETRSVQDLEGSTSDFVAEAEGATTKGLRSMPHEEHTKREQTEQESKDERKKRKQAKKQAKHRTGELEQAEQKAKDKRKKNRLATKQAKNRIRELEKSEQIANDRIRELEQKLELQEASSSSGDGQAK